MITFRSLFVSELRRCLSRRAVKVLVGIALLGIGITGVVLFLVTDPAQVEASGNTHLSRLGDLWVEDGESTLTPPLIFLAIGALIGGAVVVGGEWKTGSIITMSTWEVRRWRLIAARLLACAVLAPAIGLALIAVFLTAIMPTVLVKGSTAGLDGEWASMVAGGIGRALVLVSLAAVLGGAIASLGRSTAAALAAVFLYNALAEPIVRSRWPEHSDWLLGENIATWFTGTQLENVPFDRAPVESLAVLVTYAALLAFVAALFFRRRDLGAAT